MDFPEKPVIKTFDQIDTRPGIHNLSQPLLFRFPSLQVFDDLVHAVFSRHGGLSRDPYFSLNASYETGDDERQVKGNLELIRKTMKADRLIFSRQVHGRETLIIDQKAFQGVHPYPGEADALMTTLPGPALMIKLADCQGTILYDPEEKVLSVVHCGWRGHVLNIYRHVVQKMVRVHHCRPENIRAVISPSLGPCCAEFRTYPELFPESFLDFMERKYFFNLWELGKRQLTEAGLTRANVETAGICTRCRSDLFYSYRGEGRTGRFAMAAMLRKEKDE